MRNLKDFSFVFFFLVSQLVTKCLQISGYHLLSPPHCAWISLFSQVTTSSSSILTACYLSFWQAQWVALGPAAGGTGPGGGWHWAQQWVALWPGAGWHWTRPLVALGLPVGRTG